MSENKPCPPERLLRLKQVLAPAGPVPFGKSKWWDGVRKGDYPQPVRHGRVTAWRESDIRALIERIAA